MDITIRPVTPADVPAVVGMVHDLAEFEQAAHECHLTEAQLTAALFDPAPALFGHVAVREDEPIGFALWFRNFSTWRGVHGVYLEDLYVRPGARGRGIATALLEWLRNAMRAEGWARVYWVTRAGNEQARRLYDRFTPADDFVRYTLRQK